MKIDKSFFWKNVIYISKSNLPFLHRHRPSDAPTKEEIINELIETCLKYDVEYDSFHNHIPSFNREDSKEIEDRVAEEVDLQKKMLKCKL